MTTAAQNSKQILAQKGTAATPSFSFLGGNASGMYSAGTNQLGFSTAGVNAVTIDASQNVTVTGSFITPMVVGGTTASSSLTLKSTSGVGTSDSILFKVGNNGATTAMTIDTLGSVGIGTSSPTVKLDVRSSSSVLANFVGNNANNYVQMTDNNGTNWASFGSIAGGNWYLYTSGYGAMYTGGTERMRIDSSGNVGIGTASPAVTGLHVYNAGTPVIRLSNPTVSMQTYVDTSYCVTGTVSNHPYAIVTNNTTRMTIDTSGNVTTTAAISDSIGNVRDVPQNAQTAAYVLVASDNGKHISITTGGVTVNSGIFSAGQSVTVYNNSASSQTITQGTSVTMYLVGTATTGNRTLAQRGLCTIFCVASNTFVITGGGLT